MSMVDDVPAERPWTGEGADIDVGFPDLLSVLAKRKITLVVVAVLVAAISVGFAVTQKATYTSEGSVLVATTAQPTAGGAQVLATETQLARSRPVALLVVGDLGLRRTPEDVVKGLSVSVPLGTQLLDFKYTSASRADAQRIAQAFVDSYLKFRAQLLQGMLASSKAISDQADSLRQALADAEATAARSGNAAAVATANAQAGSLTDEITALDQKLTTLLASDNLVTSTSAQNAAPAVVNKPSVVKAGVVGLVAGLLLGALAALAFEYVGRRPRKQRLSKRRQREAPDTPPDQVGDDDSGIRQVERWTRAVGHPPA